MGSESECTALCMRTASYRKVYIHMHVEAVVWKGSQKRLFRKYASDRSAAVSEIKSTLSKLKRDRGL